MPPVLSAETDQTGDVVLERSELAIDLPQ